MIAKLIAHGETREAARQRALAALRTFPILGIRTNTSLLDELLVHPRFVAGELDTRFLDAEADVLRAKLVTEPPAEAVAVATALGSGAPMQSSATTAAGTTAADPWATLQGWRV